MSNYYDTTGKFGTALADVDYYRGLRESEAADIRGQEGRQAALKASLLAKKGLEAFTGDIRDMEFEISPEYVTSDLELGSSHRIFKESGSYDSDPKLSIGKDLWGALEDKLNLRGWSEKDFTTAAQEVSQIHNTRSGGGVKPGFSVEDATEYPHIDDTAKWWHPKLQKLRGPQSWVDKDTGAAIEGPINLTDHQRDVNNPYWWEEGDVKATGIKGGGLGAVLGTYNVLTGIEELTNPGSNAFDKGVGITKTLAGTQVIGKTFGKDIVGKATEKTIGEGAQYLGKKVGKDIVASELGKAVGGFLGGPVVGTALAAKSLWDMFS
jgi:hypothetical protein